MTVYKKIVSIRKIVRSFECENLNALKNGFLKSSLLAIVFLVVSSQAFASDANVGVIVPAVSSVSVNGRYIVVNNNNQNGFKLRIKPEKKSKNFVATLYSVDSNGDVLSPAPHTYVVGDSLIVEFRNPDKSFVDRHFKVIVNNTKDMNENVIAEIVEL